MHSTKIVSSIKKHDVKAVHQMKKSFPIKTEDGKDDLIGMKLKNLKPQLVQSRVKVKSVKHETVLQKNLSILESRPLLKISEKRKNEKGVNVDGKRLKCESNLDIGPKSTHSGISSVKKQSKSKIVYPKTYANYVCKFCCRRFHSVDLLREHAASHGNKPAHVCYLCNHQAATFSALMTHYLKHSGTKGSKVENIYAKSKADFCNIQFNISSRPKSAVRCIHCKSSFPSREKLDSHSCLVALEKKEYNCAYCGQVSSSIDDYRNHVQSHSVTPFMCSYCNFKLQTKKQLDKHYDVCKKRPKPKAIILKCDKCFLQCKNRKEFNLHVKTCNKPSENVPQVLHCFQCNTKFETNILYENHILTCKALETEKDKAVSDCATECSEQIMNLKSDKEKYLCSVCGDMFNNKSEYKSHGQNCPLDAELLNEKSSVLCPTCGDIFCTSVINIHLKSCALQNEDTKNIEASKQTAIIDTHAKNDSEALATRRSARLFGKKCSFTEDSDSKSKKVLKIKLPKKPKIINKIKGRRNRKSKNMDNSFICNICNFTFCSKSTLLRHKRMHSGNPWFICKYCGKFFFRKDVYIRHEINVHNKSSKTVFCCYYCKVYFSSTLQLKEHVLEIHKDSAFLPMKIQSENDKNKAPILIKMEAIHNDGEEQATKLSSGDINDCRKSISIPESETLKTISSASSSSTVFSPFKCGICFTYFENVLDMEMHLKCHDDNRKAISCQEINPKKPMSEAVCDDLENGKITTSSNMKNFKPFDNHTHLKSSSALQLIPKSSFKTLINTDNLISGLSNESVVADSSPGDTVSALEYGVGNSSEIQMAEFSSEQISVIKDIENEKGQFLCKLCLRAFSNKQLVKAHENTVHKIIDWYQCLACDACGPKQEMQEHMFMHMYKVGTFVINTDANNFDSILPCLTDYNQSTVKEVSNSHSSKNLNDHLNTSDSEFSDKNIENDLPPLREFGLDNLNTSYTENSLLDTLQTENNISKTVNSSEGHSDEEQENNNKISNKSETSLNIGSTSEKEDSFLSETASISESNPVLNTSISEEGEATFDISKNCVEDTNQIHEIQDLSQKDNLILNQEQDDGRTINRSNLLECESTNGDQNENFSHLRYLLENFNTSGSSEGKGDTGISSQLPSPMQSPQKIKTLKKFSENSIDTGMFSLKQLNQDLGSSSNTVLSNSADLSKQSSEFSNENNCHSLNAPELNQSFSTCLKFDITQSRGEFSENIPLQSKSQSSDECMNVNKTGNIFKPGHSHNTILDFSDLLQNSFGDSISAGDDNVFQYLCQSNQASTELPNYCEKISTLDNKVTNDVINCSHNPFPSTTLKCNNCNGKFQNSSDLTKHICSEDSVSEQHVMLADENKCKSTFFPSWVKSDNSSKSTFEENSNKTTFEEVKKSCSSEASIQKSTPVSVSCSICSINLESINELEQHYQADHIEYTYSLSANTKCNRCHRTFSDVNECVKHSLNCLKPIWYKNSSSDECLQSTGTLRSLLIGKEAKIMQETGNLNSSPSYENIISEFPYENTGNLPQHAFDS